MSHSTRVWPDLRWVSTNNEAGFASSELGTFYRRVCGNLGEEPLFEVWFSCACCAGEKHLGRNIQRDEAYRRCTEYYRTVCKRADDIGYPDGQL